MGKMVSPTVLVVDDEERFGRGFKRALLDKGSIGSVVVNTIGDAADLILDKSLHFDALLADLYFETGDDPARDLYDGLDLIEFSAHHRPEIEAYAVSAHADAYGYKQKFVERKIPVKHLFDKREFDLTSNDTEVVNVSDPWNVVRIDVYRRRLAADPSLTADLDEHFSDTADGNALLGRILASVSPPTITYIETLPRPLVAKCPIQVVCTSMSDGSICASAPHLGLFVDGHGDAASEAVDSLREVITTHATELLGEDEFTGYAAALKSHLMTQIEYSDDAN